MRVRTFTIAAVAFVCITAAPPVTFESPCSCRDAHNKGRRAVKNDASPPPAAASTIQSITPSDVFSWPGIDVQLTWQSERIGIENKWFALTGPRRRCERRSRRRPSLGAARCNWKQARNCSLRSASRAVVVFDSSNSL